MSGSNPPSTSGSPCLARRALLTAAAAVIAVAAPVVFVATTAGASSSETAEAVAPSLSSTRREGWVELLRARSTSGGTVQSQATTATPAVIDATATPAPPPAPPAPAAPPVAAPRTVVGGDPDDPATWDRLAQCESGGSWAIDTGNGYYGGLQFSLSSWRAVGGVGYPHESSRETQIEMGRRLHAQGGWSHWPGCTRSFGWPQ